MSGFLGGVGNAVQAISGLASLFGGAPPVILGWVQFADIEVPAHIPFGGQQRLAVHKLPGGARVIDAMGRDDVDLNWAGYLEGPFATDRALEIDQMRVAGVPVTLTWDALSFTVLVASFSPDFHRTNWIPYQIRCVVLMDNAAAAGPASTSLASQIASDLSTSIGVALPSLGTVETALGTAETATLAAGALTKGTQPYIAAISALQEAQTAVGGAITVANGGLAGVAGGVSQIGGILGTGDPIGAVVALGSLTAAATNLSGLLQVNGYVGRALTNLTNASA